MSLCECRCGQEAKKRFVVGHNRRLVESPFKGRHFTEEQQAARSALFKELGFRPPVPTPESRRKAAEALKGHTLSAESRAQLSVSLKASPKFQAWVERMHTERRGPGNPAWKGGRSRLPYHYSWTPELKALIRDRDGGACKSCGRRGTPKRAPDVHHLNGDKQDCRPENLITLCHPCHQRAHVGTGVRIEGHKLDPIEMPTPWRIKHAAETAEAQRLYASGLSALTVAERMGRKPATVNYWLRRLGVTRSLAESQGLRRGREGAHDPKPPRAPRPRVETGARSVAQRGRRERERRPREAVA